MKKLIISTVVCFSLFISSSFASKAHADLDPRFKMLGTMAGYGAVGGALLGAASLAFDTGGRAVAKGASLGLYAGILFGGYILVNYEMGKRGGFGSDRDNYYPNSSSPYEDDQASLLDGYSEFIMAQVEQKKDPKVDPSFSFSFFNMNF